MRVLILILFWTLPATAAPPVVYQLDETRYLVKDELYVSIVDAEKRCPTDCCYTVTAGSQTGAGQRRNFRTLIPSASLERSDYLRSGYDIGHLAPLGSLDGDAEWGDVNYLENCAPQTPELNRGPWLKLEERERDLAAEHGRVNVSVRVEFTGSDGTLVNADESHQIPSHFSKWISWQVGTETKVERYRFPQNVERNAPLANFLIP